LNVGWRKSAHAQANRILLEGFTRGAVLEPIDAAVASAYGEIRAELETLGTPIGANDMWIAAQARATKCVLVTHDVDEFTRVRGLKVQDWVNR
jgi:tRNA(fMet)-specific endonuclease VapC